MAQPLLTLVPKIPSLSLFALKSGLVAPRGSAVLVMLMRSPGFLLRLAFEAGSDHSRGMALPAMGAPDLQLAPMVETSQRQMPGKTTRIASFTRSATTKGATPL